MKLTKKPKRGDRFLNYKGEYCVVKYIYKNTLQLQITGIDSRTETWKLEDFIRESDRFWIVPYPKINRTNVARHILEYQLNMIGKTTVDTKENSNWYKEWTITDIEYNLFKKYSIFLLKKTFRFNTNKANATFEWFNMQFGLKRKNT